MKKVMLQQESTERAVLVHGEGGEPRPATLSELIESHCAALQREKPADEPTQRRYREQLDTMLQLMGNREITEYAYQDLLTLKSHLLKWPVHAGKAPEFRDKSAAEILRMKVVKTLDKRIVDTKYMQKMVVLFQYAFRNGWIDRDITQNLTPSRTVAEQRAAKRKIYNATELSKIFAALPFHRDRPHLAWLPLLAAFSGARAGELCRLRVSDIAASHAIPFMILSGEDDRGNLLKNLRGEPSLRLVPLHPVLVEMGLLRFLAWRQTQGRELLFERRLSGGGAEPLTGSYYAHTFELFNRRFITKDLRKGFDSFRANVHHELQLKNVAPELASAITGSVPQYDDPGAAAGQALLAEKYAAVVQLRYPAIDLQALKEKFSTILPGDAPLA